MKPGVYQHKKGKLLGNHSMKIVGWGVTKDGVKYWSIVNSYGKNFGEDGQ